MADDSDAQVRDLERYRSYLRLLARLDLDPQLEGKIDLSGIVQLTLLEAHQGIEQIRGSGDKVLAAWLERILVRNLLDEIRKLKRVNYDATRERSIDESTAQLEMILVAEQSSPSERASRNEQLLQLASAIEQLPTDQQTAVVRHHLQGAALADVAREMNRTKEAVAGLLHRGLTKLRDLLAEKN